MKCFFILFEIIKYLDNNFLEFRLGTYLGVQNY